MYRLFVIVFAFHNISSYAQVLAKDGCKIEIYLLSRTKPNVNSSEKRPGKFFLTSADLIKEPLVKNDEILSYHISKDTVTDINGSRIFEKHRMNITPDGLIRIKDLNIPLCCGKQFAVVVNDVVVYGGYFWNYFSSFGSNWITATAIDSFIQIEKKLPDYNSIKDSNDPRKNKSLFECLKATKRLKLW